METNESIPEDAVWFHPDDFREMLHDWLISYEGMRCAQDAMEKAHGDWIKKRVS